MSLSDCPECWSTPCEYGHEYKNWSKKRLQEFIEMLQKILDEN